jgi:hypothetical protein
MSLYINDETKLVFIHIPKNGGVFVSSQLVTYYNFKRNEGMFPLSIDYEQFIKSKNENYKIRITRAIKNICNNGYKSIINEQILNYNFFCFSRCPYQRFISGILYSNESFLKLDTNKIKDIILNINNLANGKYLEILTYSHIFVTQSQFIKNIPNLKILNFENINNDLCDLLLTNNFQLKHNDVPLNNTKKSKNFWEYYDNFVLDFVNFHFDEDFKKFNYQKYNTLTDFYYNMKKKYYTLP